VNVSRIVDLEARQLATLSLSFEPKYVDAQNDPWIGSPFGWIKNRPSRQIGAIGEALVASWCSSKGFTVDRPPNSDCDRIINGLRVEIKFSTLWTDNKIFKFQQIRDQEYDFCFCLGVSPENAQAWFIPKSELMFDRPPALVHQHGGSSGRDTRWLSFQASSPPEWLTKHGGSLGRVRDIIARL